MYMTLALTELLYVIKISLLNRIVNIYRDVYKTLTKDETLLQNLPNR